MTDDYVAGIDVSGREKGFQIAILGLQDHKIRNVFQVKEGPEQVWTEINKKEGECKQIAIDSPPQATIPESDKTRLAERQLNKDGYNVQWTSRNENYTSPGEWMENGEELWNYLDNKFEDGPIETFPTACADGLPSFDVQFPLSLISGTEDRKVVKDYIDASICAIVAREYHVDPEYQRLHVYGLPEENGDNKDEGKGTLGLIHVLKECEQEE